MDFYPLSEFDTLDNFMNWLFSAVPEFYIHVFMLYCLLALFHELLKWGRRF